jgi:hypothetical protein
VQQAGEAGAALVDAAFAKLRLQRSRPRGPDQLGVPHLRRKLGLVEVGEFLASVRVGDHVQPDAHPRRDLPRFVFAARDARRVAWWEQFA